MKALSRGPWWTAKASRPALRLRYLPLMYRMCLRNLFLSIAADLFRCLYAPPVLSSLSRCSTHLSPDSSPGVARSWHLLFFLSLRVGYIFMTCHCIGELFICTLNTENDTFWAGLHSFEECWCFDLSRVELCRRNGSLVGLWRLRFQFHCWNREASFLEFCPVHAWHSQQLRLHTWKGRKHITSLFWRSFPESHSLFSTMVASRSCPLDRVLRSWHLTLRLPLLG